jgi:hypothetical protein
MSRERNNLINSLQEKLRSYLGKHWLYSGDANVYRFQSFDLVEDNFTIITQNRRFVKDYNELGQFLKAFKPVDEPALPANVGQKLSLVEQTQDRLDKKGMLDKVAEGLFSAFERLQNDPAFVPQAKEMNNVARNIIEAQKTKIRGLEVMAQFLPGAD